MFLVVAVARNFDTGVFCVRSTKCGADGPIILPVQCAILVAALLMLKPGEV